MYENLAESWAALLDQPFDTTGREFELSMQLILALFTGVTQETLDDIETDPQRFAERVALYRYARAMKDTPAL